MSSEDQPRFLLEIVSDTICPWCFIAKRRLDKALEMIGDEMAFEIRWRPFELNPDMPRDGLDRRAYRSHKFGSWERSLELDAQVKEAGAQDGLAFHHERMEKTPNTLASHVLVRAAQETGNQSSVIDALFRAYFTDGRDVGDPAVLVEIGVEGGVVRAHGEAVLADEELRNAVQDEARAFGRAGIRGVPTLLLNRFVLFSGAQEPSRIAAALRRASGNREVVDANMEAFGV